MVKTPVLFITFVRPDYARKTWEGIKTAQPKVLYFYSNKGRVEKDGEIERNEEIRNYVNEIDWNCEIHTWFRDNCVNVYDSLRGAITWLFDNEDCGIVLEEDCVPTLAFFSFCDQMIEKFREEQKVWCISGDNIWNYNSGNSYHFSHYHFMYGWASWADRWNKIDWNNLGARKFMWSKTIYNIYETRQQVRDRRNEIRRVRKFVENTKCWDYYWGIVMDAHCALTVHPSRHLVQNIGLDGTHHQKREETLINTKAVPYPEIYNVSKELVTIAPDYSFDSLVYNTFFKGKSLAWRIANKFFRILGLRK